MPNFGIIFRSLYYSSGDWAAPQRVGLVRLSVLVLTITNPPQEYFNILQGSPAGIDCYDWSLSEIPEKVTKLNKP